MLKIIFALLLTSLSAQAQLVKGMNLTQWGTFVYDAANGNQPKTDSQLAVDAMYEMGVRHVVLNPQARMTDPRGSDVIPETPVSERAKERQRYKRLIDYIHSKGMTVGIRPIFFVIGADGSFPYIERQPDGTDKIWWHGNIQPDDPDRWFESFKQYLDLYLLIARLMKVEEFTIGAELYSMTVGIEDQWLAHPHGFPGKWLQTLRYVRGKLGNDVRIMYDINFTDDRVDNGGDLSAMGGELERWRYRLVDLAEPTDPAQYEIWQNLVTFWNELDAVGVDMYRSLAGPNDVIPTDYRELVNHLRIRADEYASQIDITLSEIEFITGESQTMIFKEVGYRSVENGFINPFEYEDGQGVFNQEHQAAAYQALFESFWQPGFSWFGGAAFWDVSVNPARNRGGNDTGFSPVGKPLTSQTILDIFNF